MLEMLLTKFKCNIAIYNFNVEKTSNKQPQMSISRMKHCKIWKDVPLVLLQYKKLKRLQILNIKFFLIVSKHDNIMLTAE